MKKLRKKRTGKRSQNRQNTNQQKKENKNKQIETLENSNNLGAYDFVITTEPIRNYPQEIQNKIEALYELAYNDPKSAIPQLEEAVEKYPQVPTFQNYLSVAYGLSRNNEKAIFWIKEANRRHPNYLIAKISLANLYIENNKLEKVEELFNNTFDLKALYPKRKAFHITEVISFVCMVGFYAYAKGELKAAKTCYDFLNDLAPDHPQTKELRDKLHPIPTSFFIKSLRFIIFLIAIPILLVVFIINLLTALFRKSKTKSNE